MLANLTTLMIFNLFIKACTTLNMVKLSIKNLGMILYLTFNVLAMVLVLLVMDNSSP